MVACLSFEGKSWVGSSADTGKGKSKMSKHVTHGYHLVKGKSSHPMEDYVVAEFKQVEEHELGLFAIFDGHLSHDIPDYLRSHLFVNSLNEVLHASCTLPHVYWIYMCLICLIAFNEVNLLHVMLEQNIN